jgi:cyclic di-GMP phosphodiesterase
MKNGKQVVRILLIEDDSNSETLIKKALEREGYTPIILRVETEAATQVAISSHDKWDLIICDYILPSFSAKRALKLKQDNLGDIPFIVLSGYENEETALEMLRIGAHDFVYKSQLARLHLAIKRELKEAGERLSSRLAVEKAYIDVVEAWGIAMERRDIYTKDHTIRVTDTALRFARALGIAGSQFRAIRFGSLLHDIGKIGIPDAVLLKRDALSLDEISIMRLHPGIAYEMLSENDFLKEFTPIPYCHHEKFDGTGYPRGLLGEEIPIEARLFSICDVYDALTNERPYRKPWEKEKAIAHLRDERGKSFEPRLVDLFTEMIK